jgi:hypothetical protein
MIAFRVCARQMPETATRQWSLFFKNWRLVDMNHPTLIRKLKGKIQNRQVTPQNLVFIDATLKYKN